jgi:hypothetical protein
MTVTFSRNLNSSPVLPIGSQLVVTDPATGQASGGFSNVQRPGMGNDPCGAESFPDGPDPISAGLAPDNTGDYSALMEANYQ